MPELALVSIVIPTYKRLPELRLAVESALAQTYAAVEVIVVSDGPDPEMRAAMEGLHPRLRYFEQQVNSGPADARNLGVRHSRGEWLAFLDDDDTMLPEKFEKQMQLAMQHGPGAMIACRTIYRHDGHDDIWPSRPLKPREDIGDYILVRPSLRSRPGVIPLTCLLVHRDVLTAVPFTTHDDHEDWAWLLEVCHGPVACIEFVWEPLVVYNIATERMSRSRRMNWRHSLEWAMRYRHWLSPRAFNSFLSTKVALKAKRAGDSRGLREIIGLVFHNKPNWLDLLFLAGITLLPGFVLHAAWKRSLHATNAQPTASADRVHVSGEA